MSGHHDAILDRLQAIFRIVFMQENIALQPCTTMNDVAGWDSLANISLMLAVQQHFAVRFSARDQHALNNVADLVALLEAKLLVRPAAP